MESLCIVSLVWRHDSDNHNHSDYDSNNDHYRIESLINSTHQPLHQ